MTMDVTTGFNASFPFDFEGWMWDLIVLVPDYCLPIFFAGPKPSPSASAVVQNIWSA